jgi:hypothetical protein
MARRPVAGYGSEASGCGEPEAVLDQADVPHPGDRIIGSHAGYAATRREGAARHSPEGDARPAAGADMTALTDRYAMTAANDRADISDSADPKDSTDPSDPADATQNAEANDPIDPTDSAEPTEPMDSTEPRDPIDKTESRDHSDHSDELLLVSLMWALSARAGGGPLAAGFQVEMSGYGSFQWLSLAAYSR